MPRRKFLDEAAPSDMTYNSVRPIVQNIQVKRKDTPARREQETRRYKQIKERQRVTPVNQRQASIGPYREKTDMDRAGGRLYAEANKRANDAKAREEAGVVLNSLFKPVLPSTYVDMLAAYKNGQVNNIGDALAAPYITGSWSQRNPGRALALDVLTPVAGADIARSYKAMRAGLKNPRVGIIPDASVPSGYRFEPDELTRINSRPQDIWGVMLDAMNGNAQANMEMSGGTAFRNIGSQANNHLWNWLNNNAAVRHRATDEEILRFLSEYQRAPYDISVNPIGTYSRTHGTNISAVNRSGSAGNSINVGGVNIPTSGAPAPPSTVYQRVAPAHPTFSSPTSTQEARDRLKGFFENFEQNGRAERDEFDALVDYLRANEVGFDDAALDNMMYGLGQTYGVNAAPMVSRASDYAGMGKAASKVPILKEARRRKQVVKDNIAKGMTKEEADAAERATRENIYWDNRKNQVVDFNQGLLTQKEYDALPGWAKMGGRSYKDYRQAYATLADQNLDTMTSTYVRNDFPQAGALTGLDIGRFIEEAPHGERINIHSLSTDSYPAILQNLLRYGDKGPTGIKIQQHPNMVMFNGLGRRNVNKQYITTYDQIKSLTDQVNSLYGTTIPYPTMRGGTLFERPNFTIFKYKYGGLAGRRKRKSIR